MKINRVAIISFFFTLLISIDIIQIAGLRVGLLPLLLFSIFILIKDKVLDSNFYFISFFAIASLPSLLFSYEVIKSTLYIAWIFLNYFSIFIAYKYLGNRSLEKTLTGILFAFRFQIIIGFILFILSIQTRAHVLFYEPSYFAIALIPYIVIYYNNLFNNFSSNKKSILIDTILITLAVISTQSFNLMVILLIIPLLFSIIASKNKLRDLSIGSLFITLCCSIIIYLSKNSNNLIANTVRNITESQNLFITLTERTGNRWPRFELAQEIALNNFWGVGIGAYEKFTENNNFVNFSHLPYYTNPIGYPAVNIYFEIAATCGWIALVIWLYWHFKLLKKSLTNNTLLFVILLTSMIILIIESNFLRPYYWMILALVSINLNQKFKD